MGDGGRYTEPFPDGQVVCRDCGAPVADRVEHDRFHARIARDVDPIPDPPNPFRRL